MTTLDISCACGATLRQVDEDHRCRAAEEEFRAQHVTGICDVGGVPNVQATAIRLLVAARLHWGVYQRDVRPAETVSLSSGGDAVVYTVNDETAKRIKEVIHAKEMFEIARTKEGG